jgi:hypothetical protein
MVCGVALAAAALLQLPGESELSYAPLQRTTDVPSHAQPIDTAEYTRRTVRFPCGDAAAPRDTCEAWLYTPTEQSGQHATHHTHHPPWPVVLMAHGLGAQKARRASSWALIHVCS